MTTLMKLVAGLAVVVALAWLLRDLSIAPPDASETVRQVPEVSVAQPVETQPVETQPAEGAELAVDSRLQRIPVTRNSEQAPLTTIEVRVRDDKTGEVVAGASVRFVPPGFAYADIPPEHRDRYSRSTESFLRDFGMCQITNKFGTTRIPIEAASNVVVARKGNLYGTNWPRSGGKILEIAVSGHHTLVVETADELGNAIPHVKVVGQPDWNPLSQWTLGTTDDNGILTYVLKPESDQTQTQLWLQAELLDGAHGREAIDRRAPPRFVRLTLPATGIVRVKITNVGGVALDRQILESLHAELSIVGAAPRAAMFGRPGVLYIRPDAEGHALFENIVFGKTLQLRFPGMILEPKVFPGPSESERVVSIVHAVKPDHPFCVGTLVDPDNQPMVGKQFSVFCRRQGDLLASVGATTDEHGRFLTYLSEVCTGKTAVVFTMGMDMSGVGFDREVRVPVAGALHGRVDLGEVVMPNKK
ncbi:MAG: hypothetical protein ACI8UD_000511 [Planctomycetota bacterium]|jgi:hypothetical protein